MEVDRLSKIIQYCDLISGSEHKHFKEIHLFYDQGIQAYVTDGGLHTHFQIPVSVEPFERAYLLPIPGVKLFLKGRSKKDRVRVSLKESEAVLEIDQEMLAILQPNPPSRKAIKPYRLVGEFPFKEFLKGIDFASVRMAEHEQIFFFVEDGQLMVSTVYDDLTTIYRSQHTCQDLGVVVPYYNLRHLIKAYALLDVAQIRLGISNDRRELAFQISGGISVITCVPMDDREIIQSLQLRSMNNSLQPLFEMETARFKKALTKSLKLSKGSVMEMVLGQDFVELHIRHDRIYYSVKEPGRWVGAADQLPWKIHFTPEATLSMITRITSRQMQFSYDHGFLSMSDPQKKRLLMMKVKPHNDIERSDSLESLAKS